MGRIHCAWLAVWVLSSAPSAWASASAWQHDSSIGPTGSGSLDGTSVGLTRRGMNDEPRPSHRRWARIHNVICKASQCFRPSVDTQSRDHSKQLDTQGSKGSSRRLMTFDSKPMAQMLQSVKSPTSTEYKDAERNTLSMSTFRHADSTNRRHFMVSDATTPKIHREHQAGSKLRHHINEDNLNDLLASEHAYDTSHGSHDYTDQLNQLLATSRTGSRSGSRPKSDGHSSTLSSPYPISLSLSADDHPSHTHSTQNRASQEMSSQDEGLRTPSGNFRMRTRTHPDLQSTLLSNSYESVGALEPSKSQQQSQQQQQGSLMTKDTEYHSAQQDRRSQFSDDGGSSVNGVLGSTSPQLQRFHQATSSPGNTFQSTMYDPHLTASSHQKSMLNSHWLTGNTQVFPTPGHTGSFFDTEGLNNIDTQGLINELYHQDSHSHHSIPITA